MGNVKCRICNETNCMPKYSKEITNCFMNLIEKSFGKPEVIDDKIKLTLSKTQKLYQDNKELFTNSGKRSLHQLLKSTNKSKSNPVLLWIKYYIREQLSKILYITSEKIPNHPVFLKSNFGIWTGTKYYRSINYIQKDQTIIPMMVNLGEYIKHDEFIPFVRAYIPLYNQDNVILDFGLGDLRRGHIGIIEKTINLNVRDVHNRGLDFYLMSYYEDYGKTYMKYKMLIETLKTIKIGTEDTFNYIMKLHKHGIERSFVDKCIQRLNFVRKLRYISDLEQIDYIDNEKIYSIPVVSENTRKIDTMWDLFKFIVYHLYGWKSLQERRKIEQILHNYFTNYVNNLTDKLPTNDLLQIITKEQVFWNRKKSDIEKDINEVCEL